MKRNKTLKIVSATLILIGVTLISKWGYTQITYKIHKDNITEAVTEKNSQKKEEAIKKVKEDYSVTPIGMIQIPSVGVNNGIIEGQSMYDMFFGVGWDNSPIPNMKDKNTGNLVLAAHNEGRAPIFKNLKDIKNSSMVYIFLKGNTYIYKVYEKYEVTDTETSITANVNDKSILTMFTCTQDSAKRLVVRAELVERKEGDDMMRIDIKPIKE